MNLLTKVLIISFITNLSVDHGQMELMPTQHMKFVTCGLDVLLEKDKLSDCLEGRWGGMGMDAKKLCCLNVDYQCVIPSFHNKECQIKSGYDTFIQKVMGKELEKCNKLHAPSNVSQGCKPIEHKEIWKMNCNKYRNLFNQCKELGTIPMVNAVADDGSGGGGGDAGGGGGGGGNDGGSGGGEAGAGPNDPITATKIPSSAQTLCLTLNIVITFVAIFLLF